MKPVSCTEVHHDLWLYIDRELSASDLQAISSHLKQCDACRGSYHERAREASQYRMAFLDTPFGDKFAAKLRKKMEREGLLGESAGQEDSRGAPRRSAPGSGVSRRRAAGSSGSRGSDQDDTEVLSRGRFSRLRGAPFRRRFLRVATVAAMIILVPAVVIIGKIFNGPPLENLGTLIIEKGAFTVLRVAESGTGQPVVPEGGRQAMLCPGLVYTVSAGGVAHLRLAARASGGPTDPEGPSPAPAANVTLRGPARLVLDSQASCKSFHAVLEEGIFEAEVAHRDLLEPFVVDTPHAKASVVGTKFRLKVNEAETRLGVTEGAVKFQRRESLPGGKDFVKVTPETGEFTLREGAPGPVPVAAPSVSAPPAPETSTPPSDEPPIHAPELGGPEPSVKPAQDAPSPPSLDDPVSGETKSSR